VASNAFSYTAEQLAELTQLVLDHARANGASAAEAETSEGFGQGVTVRRSEVETIEYNRDKAVGVTVYLGQRRGHASTSDFSVKAVRETVDAALSIARFTASDEAAGLADEELLAREIVDLDLFHPWDLQVDQAIELARDCEAAALAVDPRITNSEGASVSTQQSQFAYGNTRGFLHGYPTSRHTIMCSVIAGEGDGMQRDDWYTSARTASDLEDTRAVGRTAGERCVRRLSACKIETMRAPILFEAPIASSLLGHFVGAASGGSLYRKSSFLLDSLGKAVFSPLVQIDDIPDIKRGLASAPFDDEGVATARRRVVRDGVLQGYFLGSYSARKLNMRSTGNAGGNHNLILGDTGESFEELLRKLDRGLLVTELLGMGVNQVTGDYSRGAAGFWVEGGEIAYPVQEITIAGNLREMFTGIIAIGNDIVVRGSRQCGSILIDGMTIAGD
jgi:PmbA protein